MLTDLHIELADGTRIGYAEVANSDGPSVVYLHGNPVTFFSRFSDPPRASDQFLMCPGWMG